MSSKSIKAFQKAYPGLSSVSNRALPDASAHARANDYRMSVPSKSARLAHMRALTVISPAGLRDLAAETRAAAATMLARANELEDAAAALEGK